MRFARGCVTFVRGCASFWLVMSGLDELAVPDDWAEFYKVR